MSYKDKITALTSKVPTTLVDFNLPREKVSTPTQASSNFITNKEQGDWAENLVKRAINEGAKNYVAVKYGKSDDVIAGEEGFDNFYQKFQAELDAIGKRPDLLIFDRKDFDASLGFDISDFEPSEIHEYVSKAIAGVEVRSSSFLIDRYEAEMNARTAASTQRVSEIREEILGQYSDLLDHPSRKKYISFLTGLTEETLSIASFKVPGWTSSPRLLSLNNLFKNLKREIKEIQKRDYLSITPKVEDLRLVYKWIETYGVPHFYFQVFFDRVYGISFEEILHIVSDEANEGKVFSVEKDTKNQSKTTIKINSKFATSVAYRVDEPDHRSVRREMGRGRLLFYVTFQGGTAFLDMDNLCKILRIKNSEF